VIGNGRFGKDGEEGEFTCLSGTNPSVIDYVLVGIELVALTVDVEVLRVVGSDHLPVEIKLCLGRGVPRNKKR
jgi:endonuclease/exonuclease/phosphatase family metal-dependent hydrolase